MTDWQDILSPGPGAPPPRHLGTRYDAAGRFLPEAGNTVVCHVPPGSPTADTLDDLHRALRALPWADRFAFTPPASFHMTVFDGVIDTARGAGDWAAGLPADAAIDATTAALAARLEGFAPPPPFRMAIAAVTPFGLSLRGATPQDEAHARAWRDALSAALGIRRANHAAYAFHLTMAYPLAWLPREALPALAAHLQRLTAQMQARLPALDLTRPAFCRFADMTAFPPVCPL